MCDVCKLEKRDWKFKCGEKSRLSNERLHRVFVGQIAYLKLCSLCARDLFHVGERRFLEKYVSLAVELSANKRQYTQVDGF